MSQIQRGIGRVFVGLLVVMLLGGNGEIVPDARAGCTNYEDYLHWVSSTSFESTPSCVFVDDTIQYVAELSFGLLVFDLTNESTPSLIGALELSGDVVSVSVSGNIAAIVSETTLYIVDISDPSNPVLIGNMDPDQGGAIADVVTVGDFAYLTIQTSWKIAVIDFSTPESPVLATTVATQSEFSGIQAVGDLLYAGTHTALEIIDISPPENSHIIGHWPNFAYQNMSDFIISGNTAYIINNITPYSRVTLHAVNISSPTAPSWLGGLETTIPDYYWPHMAEAAGIIYVGYSSGHYQRYTYQNGVFTYLDYIPRGNGYVGDMVVFGPNLYICAVTIANSIHTFSVQSPSPMEPIGSVATSGDAQKVVIPPNRDTLAYVASGSGGMQVINIEDPENPYVVGSVDTPGNAVDISITGNRAYVADSDAGIHIIDISISTAPVILHTVDTPGTALNLAVSDTIAYLADGDSGLQLINISENNTPAIISNLNTDGFTQGVDIAGTLCYVADGIEGLLICDVSDPDSPDIIGGVKNRDLAGAMKVDARGDFAYVTDGSSGLVVLNINDPENPVVAGASETESTAQDVDLLGIIAFVADSGSGVKVINIEDPDNPEIIGNMDIPTAALSVFANENYAYVAAGSGGLQICPTQCGYDQLAIADFTSDIEEAFYPITVQFTDTSIGYGLDYAWDFGDSIGTSTEADPVYSFDSPGAYTVTLTITNGVNQDVTSKVVSALTEPPTITTITDIPNDQGGKVYVDFFRCGFDNDELSRLEMYTIERLDNDTWVAVATTGAYGRSYYSVEATTQGDGFENWNTQFRVIGHMEEGNWASVPVSGFSLDNIAPEAPGNVIWVGTDLLGWDPVPANDFAYYQVYGSVSNSFEQAEPIGTTVITEYTVDHSVHTWFFIVAVDDAGLESNPSSPVLTTGVPGLPTELGLMPAVPNPFNPSTRIQFSLTKSGMARLVIYDIGGRLVKTMVQENLAAGSHDVFWHGRNEAGRRVSSGTYFYRLEAEGKELIQRMILVK